MRKLNMTVVWFMLLCISNVFSAETPAVQPVCLKKPVPSILPVKIDKLSNTFDWIQKDRIRVMYGYNGQWKETALLDKIVEAGFNCIIYHTAGESHSETGFYQEAEKWLIVQRERKLHVFVGMPFGSDERYANNQFGLYQPGGKTQWTHTPCPLSLQYWDKVVGERAVAAARLGLAGLVVDMEMYGGDSTRYSGPCYADDCWKRFITEYTDGIKPEDIALADRPAWIAKNRLGKDYSRWQELEVSAILSGIEKRVHAVNKDFILGYMLDIEPLAGLARGFGTPTMPCIVLSELEYGGNISGVPRRVDMLKELGYPAMFVPGFWTRFPPSQYADLIAQVCPPAAGYWIWGSGAFMDWGIPGGEYGHAENYSNEDYWKAFRRSNDILTDILRSGKPAPQIIVPKVPSVNVPRIDHPPSTDTDWNSAAVISTFAGSDVNVSSQADTRAKILWDGKKLYLRFICDELAMDTMPKPSLIRDDLVNVWKSDSVEIFWMRQDGTKYIQILINSAGTVAEQMAEGLRPEDLGWNADIKAEPKQTGVGWELWVSIPLEADGLGAVSPGSQIRMELVRNRWKGVKLQTTCWPQITGMFKASPGQWGELFLE
jgi:hypothetical protein